MEYTISGFGSHDSEFNEIYDAFTIYMNRTALSEICSINGIAKSPVYYVRFSSDSGITKRINEIKTDHGLADEAIDENTALLAIKDIAATAMHKCFIHLPLLCLY